MLLKEMERGNPTPAAARADGGSWYNYITRAGINIKCAGTKLAARVFKKKSLTGGPADASEGNGEGQPRLLLEQIEALGMVI